MPSPWLIQSASSKYGAMGAPANDPSPLAGVAGPSRGSDMPVWHPEHPFFWFGVIAAGAVGLMGFSTHARVGPVHAAAGLGGG